MPADIKDATLSFVPSSAGAIACFEAGQGRVAVLMLHGSGFSHEVFAPLMAHPALAGMRLVAIDLPGHGRSENARNPALTYSIPGLAAVVREVLLARGLRGCVMLGWSLGGDIAMEFLTGEPVVSGLALVGAPPVGAGLFGRLLGYTLTGVTLAAKPRMSEAEAARFESLCLGTAARGEFIDVLQRTDPALRPQLARSVVMDAGCNQRRAVLETPLPVWLVAGKNDPLVRLPYLRRLGAQCRAGCSPWVVPAAGHAPFLEAPGTFAPQFATFVGQVAEGRVFAG